MNYLITSIIYFILIFIVYFFSVEKPQKRKKYRRHTADALILRNYYKIDLKKIGYKKVYRYLNITNSILITFLAVIVIPIENIIVKMALVVLLVLPVIWFGYYVLAKILERLVIKNEL